MNDVLLRLEEACLGLEAVVLFVPGAVAAGLGLLLWLGGQRYSKSAAGLLGASAGAWVGLMASGLTGAPTAISVGIAVVALAVIAIFMRRIIIIALAAIIFAAVMGSGYLGHALNDAEFQDGLLDLQDRAVRGELEDAQTQDYGAAALNYLQQVRRQRQSEQQQSGGSIHSRAMDRLRTTAAEVRLSASENTGLLIVWIAVGAIVGIVLACLLGKLIISLCCSVVGTAAIIAGMCMLVLAKGTPVISALAVRPKMMMILCGAMVLFGWIVQIVFGLGAKAKEAVSGDESEE